MSRSEFRFNKKRKHYAYIFKDTGVYRQNILLSSKSVHSSRKNRGNKNIRLYRHPNVNKSGEFYLIPKVYNDHKDSFANKVYSWCFHKNDKRKVKRIKKQKRVFKI